jgi:hypothetical protein
MATSSPIVRCCTPLKTQLKAVPLELFSVLSRLDVEIPSAQRADREATRAAFGFEAPWPLP